MWTCKYCKKGFTLERAFMKHECTQLKRSKEIQTMEGKAAYGFYKMWLEKQRRTAPSVETFMTSAYYSSFIQFAAWTKDVNLADPERYIATMASNNIAPALWRRDLAYSMYLEQLDKYTNPIDQAISSADTIVMFAEKLQCTPGEVFQNFTIGDVLSLVQTRKLTPWLLFCSKSFKEWLSKLNEAERHALMQNINVAYWATQMELKPEAVKQIKAIAEELNI